MILPSSTDVFIIGGGPAGLAAAIAARRRGLDVIVADAARPPIDKPCGEGIMPDGLAAARALGLDLESAPGRRFPGIRFCAGARSVEAPFPRGPGLGIRRTTLHQALIDHAALAGVRLAWGTAVTGMDGERVHAAGERVTSRWIVGADGGHSRVRRWAGLDACKRESLRYGFRRHYRMAPWTGFMEIHWGHRCQLYITPVADDEVCVVLISSDPQLRLDAALAQFPAVARRVGNLAALPGERGAVSASRQLRAVCRGNVALVGDASGSVDAITGEGLCLLFQQAAALALALERGDLSLYQREHRRVGRRPGLMARLMLLLDRNARLRRGVIGAMAWHPPLFAGMLAYHTGAAI
ncbi:MAG: FAD-dependent monooxygenase [Bryobacteraceae bacterium]|jgi:flavin-dependent dehydrogenase